jgi:polyhydroxybutyrate depolymerase
MRTVLVTMVLVAVALAGQNCARNRAAGAVAPARGGAEVAAGRGSGPGNYTRHLEFGGKDRFYEIHAPASYAPGKPTPVVLVFHGGGGNPRGIRTQSGMDRMADQGGFLAVYPAGTGIFSERLLTFNAGDCCSYAVEHRLDDVGFTAALLDDLATAFSIDPKRVYATGHSNGAMLSHRLGCELSNRIAAIGSISGALAIPKCAPGRPVPVIEFHGTADQNVPYRGGVGGRALSKVSYRSVQETINTWLAVDGCDKQAVETETKGAASSMHYRRCAGDAEVVLWTLTDAGHTWPGGETLPIERSIVGAVNHDISASELLWDFFTRKALK